MQIASKIGSPSEQRTPCIVVVVHHKKVLSEAAHILDTKTNGLISSLVKRGDLRDEIGETLLINNCPGIAADRLLLVNGGNSKGTSENEFRKIVVGVARTLKSLDIKSAIDTMHKIHISDRGGSRWKIKTIAQEVSAATYQFNEFKTSKRKSSGFNKLTFLVDDASERKTMSLAFKEASGLTQGINLTKNLANRPANICTPTHLAEVSLSLAESNSNLTTQVLEEIDMEKLKMGALLSVSKGSRQPAKFIIIKYDAENPIQMKPVVLVGKGVTFDSGGISLKPGPGMDEMKYDMGGAASVIGSMLAVAIIKPEINVVGIIPATENLPDGNASKPGDIVTSMSGQTIEILNTDAEGRLILCDALTYAEQFNPEAIVDIATLTGACVVALGEHATGLLSTDDNLSNDLLSSGTRSGDKAWQLPLWPEYHKQIESPFADMANVGGRAAGTITAACFLSKFTKNIPWAHLDIAGTAWKSGMQKGATGRPVPLLIDFIQSKASGRDCDEN
jgi:leucyl aminopeptidase